MVISVSNTLRHDQACTKQAMDNAQIEKLVLSSIEKMGLTQEDVAWNDEGHLELRKPDSLKLHSLTLQMEKMGLELKMTRKTLIEIC